MSRLIPGHPCRDGTRLLWFSVLAGHHPRCQLHRKCLRCLRSCYNRNVRCINIVSMLHIARRGVEW